LYPFALENFMTAQLHSLSGKYVSALVIDDSLVFRRFLRDIFEPSDEVRIVGEGRNGIEALDLVLKLKPDVILMDMEMPLMDGMTALQHLMIHRPTPTIMFSSLSSEATARAFDVLKSGAVDFICKDFIFLEKNLDTYKKLIARKVLDAARIKISTIDPILSAQDLPQGTNVERHVIFCEECGEKQVLEIENGQAPTKLQCDKCGDYLDINSFSKYRRNTFVTVIGGGAGCFRNLLNTIPQLDVNMGGSIMVIIQAEDNAVDAFTEYLGSISSFTVTRAREGINLEGGNCYVASAADCICLRPFSAHYSLQKVKNTDQDTGSLDLAMASVSAIFKQKSAGILLSGIDLDGIGGLAHMMKNGGQTFVLSPDVCLSRELSQTAMTRYNTATIDSEHALVGTIQKLHYAAKSEVFTA
jgi:two-component system, chemotaxis family, protein-glutamate methylesterase/glutaminase